VLREEVRRRSTCVTSVLLVLACGSGCGTPSSSTGDDADAVSSDVLDEEVGVDVDAGDEATEIAPPPSILCGNGTVEPGEECDGNRMNGDGCDWLCVLGDGEEPPDLPPDPEAGHAEPALSATPLDIGADNPSLATLSWPGNRVPLASNGTVYATVWPHWLAEEGGIVQGSFIRFDTAGRRIGAPWTYELVSGIYGGSIPSPHADLAWNGTGYGLLWSGRAALRAGEHPGISFMALDADGKPVGEPVEVSVWANYVYRLGIAWNGESYGAAAEMLAAGDGPGDFGLLRLDLAGARRDPRRSVLWGPVQGEGTGGVAASDSLFVAVWTSWEPGANWVRYALAARDGTPLGSARLGVEKDGWPAPPDVVWTGEEFGIVWLGEASSPEMGAIYLARLSASGELVAPPRAVVEVQPAGEEMALAFGNASYAAGWIGYDGGHLLRMDRNGTMVDHVIAATSGLWLSTAVVGAAADDAGFGLIGTVQATRTDRGMYGSPVFVRFRVVH
jgi:cysteine-rich repeat protein